MGSTIGVSVLFTDLVDSTAIASRLSADEANDLRRRHFALLRGPAFSHGGREVKNLGDGVMVVFQGVGAALDAAVGMQQAVDQDNRVGSGPPMSIRVGVATGDCIEEDGDYFGEPVIQAARLCAAAAGGQILAPELAQVLAPRGLHEFTPLGELELKGLPDAVTASEVRWDPIDPRSGPARVGGVVEHSDLRVPLPDRLSMSQPLGFIGRDSECELLREALSAARAGQRRAVMLAGEAGLGKTRISLEFAQEVFHEGELVLYGRCDENVGCPYRPWIEAFEHYVNHAGMSALANLDSMTVGDLATLLPSLHNFAPIGSLGHSSGDGRDQYTLYSAITTLIRHLAQERLVVVVLDDLHCADRATLSLLRHVLSEVSSSRLLILGTYRETDVDSSNPLADTLAALHREVGVECITLGGLSESEILTMMETMAGHSLDGEGRALARALRDETAGNPYFVGEMLRHLSENGTISQRADGRWVAAVDLGEVGLPQTVREVVGARVRHLGDGSLKVLAACAAAGREFDVSIVAAAIDTNEDEVLEVLEAAGDAGLVREVPGVHDRFAFAHALVQHTLYQDLSASRRVRLHRVLAEVIEARADGRSGECVGELATHWFAASPAGRSDKAVTYAILAGDQALAARAPDDALAWYERALRAVGDDSTADPLKTCEVMIRLGDAQRQVGAPQYRETLLEAASLACELGADDLLVRSALANNRGWHSRTGVADSERIGVLEAALDVENDDGADRASLMALLAVEYSSAGDEMLDRRLALADEAVAIARGTGDPSTVARVLHEAVFATWIPERLHKRLAWSEEAARLADTVSDPVLDYWVSARRDLLALETHDYATFATYRARQVALAERLGQPVMRWHTTCAEVTRVFLEGDLDAAEALASKGLELGMECGQPDALSYYGAQLVTIRLLQGRVGELEDLIREQAAANPGIPSFRVAAAGICVDAGRCREALDMMTDDIAADFGHFPKDPMWFVNLTGTVRIAVAAASTGLRSEALTLASALHDALLPWSDRSIVIDVLARLPVAHSLALLADVLGSDDEADGHFAKALEIEQQMRAPLFLAMTGIEWAAFRLDRELGDPVDTRAMVTEGLEVAANARAGAIEARAHEVIDRYF